MSVFGTRPEAIKMAPVVLALEREESLASYLAVTAQHREMLDQVLAIFHLQPHYDLHSMEKRQSLNTITSKVLIGMREVLQEIKPHLVLVHGDTTTTFAAALASFYEKIPVGHVEAGLRTGDRYSPFPEEVNRRLTTQLSTLHFTPTKRSAENLMREGHSTSHIYVTGNTVIDALHIIVKRRESLFHHPLLKRVDLSKKIILLTAHRRENWGPPLEDICWAIRSIVEERDVEVVFPVHLNPQIQEVVYRVLEGLLGVHLMDPLDYETFAHLMASSHLILTDSGGIQEEAPSLGKPVLVLRDKTERPEALEAGTVKMVGTNRERIVESVKLLLDDEREYKKMARAINPYGDGQASERIIHHIIEYFSYVF